MQTLSNWLLLAALLVTNASIFYAAFELLYSPRVPGFFGVAVCAFGMAFSAFVMEFVDKVILR